VERALLPAAFDVAWDVDSEIKTNPKSKTSGQECPLHTNPILPDSVCDFEGYHLFSKSAETRAEATGSEQNSQSQLRKPSLPR
jgi:hypothetical protein